MCRGTSLSLLTATTRYRATCGDRGVDDATGDTVRGGHRVDRVAGGSALRDQRRHVGREVRVVRCSGRRRRTGDHDRDLAPYAVHRPRREVREGSSSYLLMCLGQLTADGSGPTGAERLGEVAQGGG